ncbi:MAG: LysR substrate-binding domain-containing protein [Pseudomonadota bacterium]
MNILKKDLEPELLRAFVAVVDGGGFTRAAERLHRTQSTVSQQVKRLEERLETPLLKRDTRSLSLTERGELLLGYARRLLALNEEAVSALTETRLQGHLRLGSAQEVADGGLAEMLTHFSRLHPGIKFEVLVDANLKLREAVEQGELDLAVVFQEVGQAENGGIGCEVIERLRRVWVAAPEFEIIRGEPLPLVLPIAPCLFRNSVLSALDDHELAWRIVLATPSLAGIRAAVRAGLGIGVRTERWLEADLQIIDDGLPQLPDVELVMLSSRATDELATERLRSAIRSTLLD